MTILALLAGCQAAQVERPVLSGLRGDDFDAQMEFWHRLNKAPVTCNDDAFRALLLYADGDDTCGDYKGRVETLKSRKLLLPGFDRPGTEAVSRGTAACAIVRILGERGGIMMRLVGPQPRYAVRELVYRGVFPQSSPNQSFTGSEFVGIIGRMEDYQRGDPANKPAAELPDEPVEGQGPATRPAKPAGESEGSKGAK